MISTKDISSLNDSLEFHGRHKWLHGFVTNLRGPAARSLTTPLLLATILLITWLDWATGPSREPADLYDIPIIIAAGSFGLMGALSVVAGCSILYQLTLWYYHVSFSIVDAGQILIFLVLGVASAQLVTEYLRVDDLRRQLLQLNANLNQRIAEAVAAERDAQRKLLENRRLTMLGEAAAQIAHEIKNPLVAIGGFTSRIQKQLPQDHVAQFGLGIIVQEVARLEMLLKELLLMGSPGGCTGKVELGVILEEVLHLAQPSLQQRGIKLASESPPQPLIIKGNGDHLISALLNVVLNAIQAMPEGGNLILASQSVIKESMHGVTVTIQDTGIGIAPENLQRVFEPFFTSKPGGTGLGLAVVKKTIDAHGGTVEIMSSPGEGTSVTIWLPLESQEI
jgi:signal transduction histidine kinase